MDITLLLLAPRERLWPAVARVAPALVAPALVAPALVVPAVGQNAPASNN
jgi:hypothetical protein